ncbi:MAG: AMP-binding protein [Desulforhabdus sp.]|jgi:long-chain acyl-CoA synthetase|nr:AMP-binding protein [Desulforhabdus sp.]
MPPEDRPTRIYEPTSLDLSKELTIPKLFVQKSKHYGTGKVAMREKQYGIWRPFTWQDYHIRVREIALGLVEMGLQKGDKVALIGDNRPEGLWTEMAVLCVGGIAIWLFQESLLDEVQYIVDHSDAKFLFCEGQEEVDKGLSIRNECPKLEKLIWDDSKGMRNYHDPMLIALTEVSRIGREVNETKPEYFEQMVAQGDGEDIALLFYTSGTTSLPKGVLLTHYNMLSMGQHLMEVDPCRETDDFVSYLPFAWIGEQMMSISCGLQVGYTINFPESPETAQENIREIGPHVMFAPPRLYEQMTRTIQVKHLDSSFIKRLAFRLSMKIGHHVAELQFQKRRIPIHWRLLRSAVFLLVHKKLRDHLGLSKIRYAYTGGAAMGPDHFRFFHSLGVNLKQIYGQTEIAGISVVHRNADIKFDTVGKPIPGTEIAIAEDGEILSRGSSVFVGYYKNEEDTRKTLASGWLHSGDRGFIDEDGHLVVFDRSKDVMTLKDGRPFSPQYLETRLKFSPFIRDAWVIGDKRDCVAAVVCIDYAVVGKWADNRGINYTSYSELSQKDQVYDLIGGQIREANKDLPPAARIRKFANLYKEFDADDDELTRTRKLRRAFVEKRYEDIVQALYGGQKRLHMDTTITYEDGRSVRIDVDLKIKEIADAELKR